MEGELCKLLSGCEVRKLLSYLSCYPNVAPNTPQLFKTTDTPKCHGQVYKQASDGHIEPYLLDSTRSSMRQTTGLS